MKKLVLAIIITTTFIACGNRQDTVVIPAIDTAAILRNAAILEQARVKATQDSLTIVRNATLAERQRNENNVVKRRTTTTRNNNTGTSETPTSSGSGTETNKKQGWSKAATNAAIGAGAGGIAGALIDKGKGRGTVIGAAVGAGAGYIIGRKADVKSGRVVKTTTVTTTNP
jgi:hypothetical protein